MNVKFIFLIIIIIIIHKSLIQCKNSSQFNLERHNLNYTELSIIMKAVGDAIAMTKIYKIGLITNSANAGQHMLNFNENLIKALNEKTNFTLTIENLQQFNDSKLQQHQQKQMQRLSSLNVVVMRDYELFIRNLKNFNRSHDNFYLLIFFVDNKNMVSASASKVFDEFWKLHIYNVNIIISLSSEGNVLMNE